MKFGIATLVVFIAAYIATVALYASTGLGRPSQITETRAMADGTTVMFDLEELHNMRGELVAHLTVSPGPELLDPVTHKLKEDLRIEITSVVTPGERSWAKGTLPDVWPVSLILSGDVADWPFDQYRSNPVMLDIEPDLLSCFVKRVVLQLGLRLVFAHFVRLQEA